jgi:CHAT domain-containing protein
VEAGAWEPVKAAQSPPQQPTHIQPKGAPTPAQTQDVPPLALGVPVERELAGGETHAYQIVAGAGQFLHLVVTGRSVDVVAALFNEAGQMVAENRNFGMSEPKPVLLIAESAGIFRLEVKPRSPQARRGKYEVKLEALRAPTPQDQERIAGEKAFSEGERLNLQNTAQSFRQAALKFEQAARRFQAAGDVRRQAQSLNYAGGHYSLVGEKEKAVPLMLEALPLRRALGDKVGEVNALNSLGLTYHDLDEKQKALDHLHAALDLVQGLNNARYEAMTLNNLGRTYHALGDWQRALDYHQRALPLRRAAKDTGGEGNTLNNIGRVYEDQGDARKAIELYQQALELGRASGNGAVINGTLLMLGTAHHSLGENLKATEYLEEIREASRKNGHRLHEATALYQLGHIAFDAGDYDRATDLLNKSLALWRSMGSKQHEAATLYYLARVARERDDLPSAHKLIETAVNLVENLRAKLESEELRAQYFASVQDYYELLMDVLLRLDKSQPQAGHTAAALEASERRRARSLFDLLAQSRIDIQQGIAPELKQRERVLQARISTINSQLIQMRRQPSPNQKQIAAWEEELKEIDREREQLELEIRRQHPRYGELRYPAPLRAEAIRQLLDERTALLEYALGGESSFLFVVTREGVACHRLPKAAEIAALVQEARAVLGRPGRREFAAYRQSARKLYDLLIAPVADTLAKKQRLLIAPDRALYYLPFESLLAPSADRSLRAGSQDLGYLLKRWAISYAPSASVLASLRQNAGAPASAASKQFLALADPSYAPGAGNGLAKAGKQPTPAALPMRGLFDETGRLELQRLPESNREVTRIARLYPPPQTALFLGQDAKEENVKGNPELSAARRIHFATHGLISERQPQYSGLALTLDDDPREDGLLQVYEIFNLKLRAELVVLSACQTGLGKELKGEGVIGLTRAFMYAGASSVVVSLWQVADRSTAELMVGFYQQLDRAGDKAEALRRAKVGLMQNPRYSHPYYWAPFVLVGEPRQ